MTHKDETDNQFILHLTARAEKVLEDAYKMRSRATGVLGFLFGLAFMVLVTMLEQFLE